MQNTRPYSEVPDHLRKMSRLLALRHYYFAGPSRGLPTLNQKQIKRNASAEAPSVNAVDKELQDIVVQLRQWEKEEKVYRALEREETENFTQSHKYLQTLNAENLAAFQTFLADTERELLKDQETRRQEQELNEWRNLNNTTYTKSSQQPDEKNIPASVKFMDYQASLAADELQTLWDLQMRRQSTELKQSGQRDLAERQKQFRELEAHQQKRWLDHFKIYQELDNRRNYLSVPKHDGSLTAPPRPVSANLGTPSSSNSSKVSGKLIGPIVGGSLGVVAILLLCIAFMRRQVNDPTASQEQTGMTFLQPRPIELCF